MKKHIVLALALSSGLAAAQTIYNPVRSVKDQSIALKAWGSGSIAETDEAAFEGITSVRVSTRNYFQGGVMTLANPVDVGTAFGDKNNMLRFAIRIADSSQTFGGGPAGPGPGAAGIPGRPPGGGGKGGPGGDAGVPGGAGGALGGGASTAPETLKNLRIILTTEDGKRSEVYLPIGTAAAGERQWKLVAIPLQAIAGLSDTNKKISAVAFAGDATTTFYVGEVRVINDSTPISCDTTYHDLNLALGDEITLTGTGYGGASVLRYMWDFDAGDGIQIDAEGQAVKRKFRKPGTYMVTLTVVDVFNLKKASTSTIKIVVNP
ncbi:MAG: PKD domain-containing protein [Armatimonadetes bacterium]|nr:PKD domain-containing protein [Armatimonadota bacterium]